MGELRNRIGRVPEPRGEFIVEDGLEWYRIRDYDLLDAFLVNVVTPDDQWIYVSTSGALTAGRRRAEHALFPYETDDRLHRSGGRTGPVTLIRVDGSPQTWQPFASHAPLGMVDRSLAKTSAGDRLRFEEHHPELGLTFRYTWASAGEFGLARSCELVLDEGRPPADIELLDGLVNVLPAGVELATHQSSSTLVDAYRRSELETPAGLALFTLEALISDRADPAEALRASVVWSHGLPDPTVALSERQLRPFRSGQPIRPEHLVTGYKGAFLAGASARLEASVPLRWIMVADVEQDHLAVARLRNRLGQPAALESEVAAAVDEAHRALVAIVADADGLQETADRRATVHHFANVLFNCMRGGALLADHQVEVADVHRFIGRRNRAVQVRFLPVVEALEPVVELDTLRLAVAEDADLHRLVSEYLPLVFSRRHGDPSRPWNAFHIPEPAAGGHSAIGYEGNWRDIFQNWEALVHSYPGYIESVIAKFLNASTIDGHNPYRISHAGIDWEKPEEGSWSHFGYWGDHQIVYLHRLLLAARRFHPGLLESKLDDRVFSYADVPYRIVPYNDLVKDPKNTIEFDDGRQATIDDRVRLMGSDGRLVPAADGDGVHRTSLAEKLLVPALAKLSNLVAGGGIWMNTQRPEWNDANNALVGNGVSVVTLFHLRDYLAFVDELLAGSSATEVGLGQPAIEWMGGIQAAFEAHRDMLDPDRVTAESRRHLLDLVGQAFSDYRAEVYANGPGSSSPVAVSVLRRFIAAVQPHLDVITTSAARPDGLFHAYWLLHLEPGQARLEPLYEMLEGQVAALNSSSIDFRTSLGLVDALFHSELYRPDQESFVLYPNRPPPPFCHKNRVPDATVGPAMTALIEAGAGIVRRDVDGTLRFDSNLRSARHLSAALDELETDSRLGPVIEAGRSEILEAYETVFEHRSFTGRSQTMYRYEGLGSIYWHMVSKLLFAMQERIVASIDADEDEGLVAQMFARYRRVRQGLGYNKSAAVQGSFPTDPHSHTPAHTGAQQPGMTGQVKEGVLLRWGELGIDVDGGGVRFRPVLLDGAEFLTEPRAWSPLGAGGVLDVGTLGFTYCGVPVVYQLCDADPWTRVVWADGTESVGGTALDRPTSRALFSRTGQIARIDVGIPRSSLTSSSARAARSGRRR